MKIKKLGILTLCFVLLVSTFTTPIAFAEENEASAAFAHVDFTSYKNPGNTRYPSISVFNADPASYFGDDGNSPAFGENLWYMYNNTNNAGVAGTNGATLQSWSEDSNGKYTIPNADLSLRLKNNNNDSTITGIYRRFNNPISVTEDKTYYFNFVASLSSLSGQTANEMRLGVLKSNNSVTNRSYEVDVFGGLKLNTEDSTYRAQVSLDKGTTVATGTNTYSLGTTYNFLMRLDIDADDNDTLRMKVYEVGADEPATWDVTTTGDLGTSDLDRLSMDAYDITSAVAVYEIDIEAYDTELLDSVKEGADAKFAAFKYSEADALEALIKTLPSGNIRTAYETKLVALKEEYNTFLFKDEFNYKPDLSTEHDWSYTSGQYLNYKINTLSKSGAAVNGWKAGSGWSAYTWKEEDNASNEVTKGRFQYDSINEESFLYLNTNFGAYRQLENPISYGTNGEYYIAFDMNANSAGKFDQTNCQLRFGGTTRYVGLKYAEDGVYAQISLDGSTTLGCKKYPVSAGEQYRIITKLVVDNGEATFKVKVFPRGTTEPAQWELVKTIPVADTEKIGFIGFYDAASQAPFTIYGVWAEKYTGANLAASEALAAGLASGSITTAAQVEAAITGGFAQNEYLAALNADTAPILGSDISYDSTTYTASLKMHNSRSQAATVQPILALYNGSELVGVTIGATQTLTAKTRDQQVSVTFDTTRIPATYTSVKVFIWNNMLNLVPTLEAWGYTIPTV